jgi:hypothetical protein
VLRLALGGDRLELTRELERIGVPLPDVASE